MQDYTIPRRNMVDCQIRTCDVTNNDLLEAIMAVPREKFVPEALSDFAYMDEDLAIGNGRFLMEPAPFAKLAQSLGIRSTDVVLDVGCGTGYSTAVLSRFASLVIAIESDEELAGTAAAILDSLDYDNVAVVHSALEDGYADEAPYDAIFVGGAVDEVPQPLFDQLKDGGKLVVVEGRGNAAKAKLYFRNGDDISDRRLFNCAVKPLPGFEKTPEFEF